jgi:hypothetical protein
VTATADPLALANQEELSRLWEWLRAGAPGVPIRPVTLFAVSGSRDWINWRIVWNALSYMPPGATMLHGKAYGLDCLAQAYWRAQGGMVDEVPATRRMWSELGSRAGIVRNEIMLNRFPAALLAFIRNNSSGSSHAATYARELDIPTFVFRAA